VIIRLFVYLVFFLFLSFICYKYSVDFSYSDFKDYLSVLLTVSSMVFTLMGLWIAFLYPNALRRLVDPVKIENVDFSDTLNETRRLEGLVGSVLKSAFVVMMIMMIFIFKIYFFNTNFYLSNIFLIKSIALSFVTILTVLQFESIFYVIYSNVMFINEIHKKREDREADEDI